MKLALIGSRGIPARYGGFETFAEELSTRLVRKGIEVTVYCEGRSANAASTYRGVKLAYLPRMPFGPASPIASDGYGIWKALGKYDVIYVLGYAAPMFFWMPKLYGQKIWVNMDGLEWARTKWGFFGRLYIKAMEKIAVNMASMVIADARAIRDSLTSRHPKMAPCAVIPYGATLVGQAPDASLLAKWGLTPQSYFISVCRLEPENHVLDIVRAFEASCSSRELVVVGSCEQKTPYIARLLREASPKVKMIGGVYDAHELRALRYHAYAYFHGHSVGGTNPSLLEALGCGNLVIAHDNAFNREVCGDLAWYFSRAADISPAIKMVESLDEAARNNAANAAKNIVATKYSWEGVANRYATLLAAAEAKG